MNSQSNRRRPPDPQRHTTKAASPAVETRPHLFGERKLPPRPMREILGDEEDLPTLADTHLDLPRKPPRAEPAGAAGHVAAGKSPSLSYSQTRAPAAEARQRARSASVYYAQPGNFDPREIEDSLHGSMFERPRLRPQPIRLPPRTPLLMLVVSLVSIMILLSAFSGSGRSVLTRFAGGGAASSIASAGGGGSLTDARPPGNYELKAPPSIGPQQIDQILADYGSPATGTGQIWYELGRRYGIDPAFAVAFFIHESGAGTSPAWAGLKPDGSTTHNVGNIICAGYPRCYGRFRDYGSWQEGIEDWYRLIDVEYLQGRGHRTVADIIPVYAPSIENDVQNYINVIHRLVDDWRSYGVR